MNHGVHVTEQATSVSTPVVATSGIPYVIGTAPVHIAQDPVKVTVPVLCTSWEDAVEKLGYSDDWVSYSLCEVMWSHFKLYGCQPVIFCNVMDPTAEGSTFAVDAVDMTVADRKVKLPIEALPSSIVVKKTSSDTNALVKDEDYSVIVSGESVIIELLTEGSAHSATSVNVAYSRIKPTVDQAAIAAGIEAAELCMTLLGTTPDLIIAPGWSHLPAVASAMAVKAANLNGVFGAKAVVDMDCTDAGAKSYTAAIAAKSDGTFVDKDMVVCWPKVALNGKRYHMSTHLSGLMAQVDGGNDGIPYDSPSNKGVKCDSLVLADGTEVLLTHAQANQLNAAGIVTAINFVGGWVAWGNYTSCYPGNTDVKDYMIPVSRMFTWVRNSLVRSFWSKIDKPMTRRLIDSVLDSANIWLNGLVGQGYLLGARVEMFDSENPAELLMMGIIKLHVYLTPPGPAQEIDFVMEYDANYVSSALLG